jgi:hypothetical protein
VVSAWVRGFVVSLLLTWGAWAGDSPLKLKSGAHSRNGSVDPQLWCTLGHFTRTSDHRDLSSVIGCPLSEL